jgi:hypothetical protein
MVSYFKPPPPLVSKYNGNVSMWEEKKGLDFLYTDMLTIEVWQFCDYQKKQKECDAAHDMIAWD